MTLDEATEVLARAGCDTPRLDAEVLLAHALGIDRTALFLRTDAAIPATFDALVARRARREPVAYITGTKGFRHLELLVDRNVLIPRPETEHLVEAALDLPEGSKVVDVGTGSGAVALALKHERPDLQITGTDTSAPALAVARKNAARLNLQVDFILGDLLAGLQADAVVSNPPYVEDTAPLAPELSYEPPQALFAGADGLAVVRRLVAQAKAAGAHFLAVEVGAEQAAHLDADDVIQDLAGHDRVVVYRW